VTNGYVLLEDGGLAQSISNQFTLGSQQYRDRQQQTEPDDNDTTGLFKGTTTNAAGKPISFNGAVLQKQTNGFGQFLNGEQSGSVYLAPQ
jgi:hypothetical protein